ncbi:5-formyltetrahydrofolate cyclo-ligase [Shewanella sp.]|nr:5-formyltetrahydrofolate cyclo-ligase [Shewanella sp.]
MNTNLEVTPLAANNSHIRQKIRAARQRLTAEQQTKAAIAAAHNALTQLTQHGATKVALYLTNDGELDTAPLIELLWQQGVQVYLPRLHPFSAGNLLFLRYDKTTTLEKNSLGIWEPKLDLRQMLLIHQLDVVITPLVAFDTTGNRMGMGGGYYDRTLANWRTDQRPLPIGYAHDCQQVDKLAKQHWDIPLPYIITPTQYHCFTQPCR